MNGIVYVVFGKEYDDMASRCIEYSRKFTNVPICINTNIEECDRSLIWDRISNIQFNYIAKSQDDNREIKTNINKYTPFDKTLYLDCDSIIQNPGIEKIFKFINDDSITLNLYSVCRNIRRYGNLYSKAFKLAGLHSMPINIYYGALAGFGCNAEPFFDLWYKYWCLNGKGREMPSLTCAANKCGMNIVVLNNNNKFFTWLIRSNYVIQHEYGKHLRKFMECPDFMSYKPFDKKKPLINNKTTTGSGNE